MLKITRLKMRNTRRVFVAKLVLEDYVYNSRNIVKHENFDSRLTPADKNIARIEDAIEEVIKWLAASKFEPRARCGRYYKQNMKELERLWNPFFYLSLSLSIILVAAQSLQSEAKPLRRRSKSCQLKSPPIHDSCSFNLAWMVSI
ncbi:hypothetical protein Pint_06295 [Pistacia integerrima]|uniref:Uncharacterized protein n=1 Tax=Pistacia integerrima TaxID=434235 RepID=A0ACC0Z3D7_9ROSI|nr:hypothetical protein Pint_06295 [Pistacia integerrima]